MIPTIETIIEDVTRGAITKQQAIAWLHQHAADAGRDLRDEFAAAALPAVITHSGHEGTVATDCRLAYDYADEMLKAREA